MTALEDEVGGGTVLRYSERRGEPPGRVWPGNPFGSPYVRYWAVVDRAQGDYLELTVTRRHRGHVHAPEPGATLAKSRAVIQDDTRWEVVG